MHVIWKGRGMFYVKEQQFLDQKCDVVTKKWFSDLSWIRLRKSQWVWPKILTNMVVKVLLGFGKNSVVCENECHVVLEHNCLNQDRYSNCNWTRAHGHLVHKGTLKFLTKLVHVWVFVFELSCRGFDSSCSHLNFRFRACFEHGVPWHSGHYRV